MQLEPAKTKTLLSKSLTLGMKKEQTEANHDKTLTELEGLWGEETVAKGLKRGDIVKTGEGLYRVRSRVSNTTKTCHREAELMSSCGKDVNAEDIQDVVMVDDDVSDPNAASSGGAHQIVPVGHGPMSQRSTNSTPADTEAMKYFINGYDKATKAVKDLRSKMLELRQVHAVITT